MVYSHVGGVLIMFIGCPEKISKMPEVPGMSLEVIMQVPGSECRSWK